MPKSNTNQNRGQDQHDPSVVIGVTTRRAWNEQISSPNILGKVGQKGSANKVQNTVKFLQPLDVGKTLVRRTTNTKSNLFKKTKPQFQQGLKRKARVLARPDVDDKPEAEKKKGLVLKAPVGTGQSETKRRKVTEIRNVASTPDLGASISGKSQLPPAENIAGASSLTELKQWVETLPESEQKLMLRLSLSLRQEVYQDFIDLNKGIQEMKKKQNDITEEIEESQQKLQIAINKEKEVNQQNKKTSSAVTSKKSSLQFYENCIQEKKNMLEELKSKLSTAQINLYKEEMNVLAKSTDVECRRKMLQGIGFEQPLQQLRDKIQSYKQEYEQKVEEALELEEKQRLTEEVKGLRLKLEKALNEAYISQSRQNTQEREVRDKKLRLQSQKKLMDQYIEDKQKLQKEVLELTNEVYLTRTEMIVLKSQVDRQKKLLNDTLLENQELKAQYTQTGQDTKSTAELVQLKNTEIQFEEKVRKLEQLILQEQLDNEMLRKQNVQLTATRDQLQNVIHRMESRDKTLGFGTSSTTTTEDKTFGFGTSLAIPGDGSMFGFQGTELEESDFEQVRQSAFEFWSKFDSLGDTEEPRQNVLETQLFANSNTQGYLSHEQQDKYGSFEQKKQTTNEMGKFLG